MGRGIDLWGERGKGGREGEALTSLLVPVDGGLGRLGVGLLLLSSHDAVLSCMCCVTVVRSCDDEDEPCSLPVILSTGGRASIHILYNGVRGYWKSQ